MGIFPLTAELFPLPSFTLLTFHSSHHPHPPTFLRPQFLSTTPDFLSPDLSFFLQVFLLFILYPRSVFLLSTSCSRDSSSGPAQRAAARSGEVGPLTAGRWWLTLSRMVPRKGQDTHDNGLAAGEDRSEARPLLL